MKLYKVILRNLKKTMLYGVHFFHEFCEQGVTTTGFLFEVLGLRCEFISLQFSNILRWFPSSLSLPIWPIVHLELNHYEQTVFIRCDSTHLDIFLLFQWWEGWEKQLSLHPSPGHPVAPNYYNSKLLNCSSNPRS